MVNSSPQLSHRPDANGPGLSVTGPRVSVLVVTGDDSLWAPVTTASDDRDAQQFDTVAELVEQWNPDRAAVVLLDGRGHVNLESAVQALLTHSTALVPVAIVDEATRVAAATLERKRALFDHILMPLDAGTARTVLDRAAEEAAARMSLAAGDPSTRASTRAAPGRRSRGLWIGAAAMLLAVAAGAAWWLTQSEEPAPAATPLAAKKTAPVAMPAAAAPEAGAGAAPSVPAEETEARLERARSAMRDKRYIEPAADNALAHYKTVLDLDAQNGEARQGLDRIAELLLARASSAMAGKDYASALRALEAARSIKPDHPRLAALDQQVNQRLKDLSATQVQAALQANAFARVAALLNQAEKTGAMSAEQIAQLRAESARREAGAQLSELERTAQVRISQGRLFEPAADSARFYMKQLQDRGGPAYADSLAHLNDLYAKRLASDARGAISRSSWSEVDVLLAELRTTNGGASLAQAQALQKDADRAREQLKALAAEATDARANAEAAREASLAAAAPAAPAAPVAATPPKLLKSLKLDYPTRAATAGIEGWVDVQFDVTAAGAAEHLRVVAAQPPGTFDDEALAAIKRARFTPAKTADGTPILQATSLRLRFSLSQHR
jgi:TonB family protein